MISFRRQATWRRCAAFSASTFCVSALLLLVGLVSPSWAQAAWPAFGAQGQPVAVFADTGYVDFNPTTSTTSEADAVATIFERSGQLVTPITGIDFQLDAYTVLAIPELERGNLGAMLDPAAQARITSFVQDGGVLVTFRDGFARDQTLLGTLFGWSLGDAGQTTTPFALDPSAAAGTPFASGAASLVSENRTIGTVLSSLPAGALAIYADASTAVFWIAPVGEGWVVSLGWDFFDAAPNGSVESDWLDLLPACVELVSDTLLRVGIFLGPRYIDWDAGNGNAEGSNLEAIVRGEGHEVGAFVGRDERAEIALFIDSGFVDYNPTSSTSEAFGLERGFADRGHRVTTFSGVVGPGFANEIDDAEVLVIPELERGELDVSLDAASAEALIGFVRGGGTLLTFADLFGRSEDLVNTLFGFSIVTNGPATSGTSFSLDRRAADGTPFAGGPDLLPDNNGTRTVSAASLPEHARALFLDGDDVAVYAIPIGNGGVVHFGWDGFDAAPNGTQDGGWRDVFDRALALRGTFETALAGRDVVVVPELASIGLLGSEISGGARTALADYVGTGGRLVIAGSIGSANFLNDVFGWSLVTSSATGDFPLQAAGSGSPFDEGPASLPTLSATRPLDQNSLFRDVVGIYRNETGLAVATLPFGDGEVVYLGWDYFQSAPVGSQDGGWTDVARIALPEPNARRSIATAALALLLTLSRRARRGLQLDRRPTYSPKTVA